VRIEPEQYRTVSACLAAARHRPNLTQTEAAERLGRKQTFVSEIERVDALEIVLISRALDADPFQLFAEVTRSALPGGAPRKASQRNSRRAVSAAATGIPVWRASIPVLWKGRAGIFRREVGDGEHGEIVIDGRVYPGA